MPLPFTKEQFFNLFAAYNEALWPAAVALWIASAVIVALRLTVTWRYRLQAWHWRCSRCEEPRLSS